MRPVVGRVRDIGRLTALSFWRGFLGFYNSDNLTYAASIAYYSLLSQTGHDELSYGTERWMVARCQHSDFGVCADAPNTKGFGVCLARP